MTENSAAVEEKKEEAKVVDFADGKLKIEKSFELDPNEDGEPLGAFSVSLWVDVSELPDEAIDFVMRKKDKKD